MSFGFRAVFLASKKEVSYMWATNPSNEQIEDVVSEMNLFRYKKEFVKVIKGLRDTKWERYVAWDKSFMMEKM